MSNLRDLPDIEKTLVAHFVATPEIVQLTTDKRISTELPSSFKGEARVQFSNNGGNDIETVTGGLSRLLIPVTCYGSTKANAWLLTQRANRAMFDAVKTHSNVVITAVERLIGPAWSPDPETDIPRYLMTFAVVAHSQ